MADNMTDTESESELNEEIPDGIDEKFKTDIVELKKIIYKAIVFSPELDTSEAQSNKLIEKYILCINDIYNLFLEAQKQQKHQKQQNQQKQKNILEKFPKESHELINRLLVWITDYFKNNEVYNTPPYQHYINTKLKVYPLNMTT